MNILKNNFKNIKQNYIKLVLCKKCCNSNIYCCSLQHCNFFLHIGQHTLHADADCDICDNPIISCLYYPADVSASCM